MKTEVLQIHATHPDPGVIRHAARCIQEGKLVAFPTETVYGLGANGLDAAAVARIFAAKQRPFSDPVILHISTLKQLSDLAVEIPDIAYRLAGSFWPGPLTLILKRSPRVPPVVTAGLDYVAIRMPQHPVALALIEAANLPIAAPSANLFGQTSPTLAAHVLSDLEGKIDLVLDGGQSWIGVESTVVDALSAPPVVLRPGGVTVEQLRQLIPDVVVARRTPAETPQAHQGASPGQLEKHYAPHARLILFTGPLENAQKAMVEMAVAETAVGKQVGVLVAEQDKPLFDDIPVMFSKRFVVNRLEEIAAELYAGMRSLDEQGADIILAHEYGSHDLGLAIYDRLYRAASEIRDCS